MRWGISFVLLLLASCAPKEDYTPQIAIEPGAPRRLCFVCRERAHATDGRCPPELEEPCALLTSDVMRMPVITWLADDASTGADQESPETPAQ
jgi:hypothetical protein